jgi:uncharacterized protein
MYPFASLPENLTAFCAVLRRDYGFRVESRQLLDAARAIEVTSIADERAVRDTLRPVLSSTVEHALVFDRAFEAFFHPSTVVPLEPVSLLQRAERGAGAPAREPARRAVSVQPDLALEESALTGAHAGTAVDVADAEHEESASLLRSNASPLEGELEPPDLMPVDRSWRDAAAAFVRRVQTASSRRWKPALRGTRFDLRRTLRSSLHTGGEPVRPRWQARPRLRPGFVVIVDGSRSMSAYTTPALQTAVAIASVTPKVEVFVFSTALERITRDARRAAAGERRHLPELHMPRGAWGGGTGIGQCLRAFIQRYGDRSLGRDTVVIIASDGLEVGSPDVLRHAMAELRRRSAAIIWLNPLIDTPGYEPTAMGMRVARAAVSTFSCVRDAAGLRRLAGQVRVRS